MRKILIGLPFLNSGGVEVSLISFIRELSKDDNNDITLLLLKKEGIYLKDVPKKVQIITLHYLKEKYDYNKIISGKNKLDIGFLSYKLKLWFALKNNNWPQYYKILLSKTKNISGNYDVAIDWHGYGHFITSVIAEKVNARYKFMWIHDEKNEWIHKVDTWLNCYSNIFCVSNACKKQLLRNKPILKNKTSVFHNFIDYDRIRKLSLEEPTIKFDNKQCNIITIGRLEWQKGYDIALKTAKILKQANIKFKWYIIGDGTLNSQLNLMITQYGLKDYIVMLGIIKNPYPYLAKSDIFVLTSRHEGYCLATLEARVLGKPIIATDIESNREQIIDNKTGYLCELNPKAFANKIIYLINYPNKQKQFSKNLAQEDFDFTKELNKLYKIMED